MPSPREASPRLKIAMEQCLEDVNKTISRILPETDLAENRLYSAMRHGVLNGGKRLRPFLAMQAAKLFNVDDARSRRVAAAIEFIHCFSLIHDDLPALDDADKRRGQPSVHKAYDEATAILAGDALMALAFEILAAPETHDDPRVRNDLVVALAKATGSHGLCGGQMLDIIGENEEFDVGTISRMQRMKTGVLIAFACEAGAILGKADETRKKALRNYAFDLGMAFQVTDDILDVEADPETLGKATGQDAAAGKSTFVTTLGKEQAKMRADMLVQQAIRHLHVFESSRTEMLQEVAYYVLERRT